MKQLKKNSHKSSKATPPKGQATPKRKNSGSSSNNGMPKLVQHNPVMITVSEAPVEEYDIEKNNIGILVQLARKEGKNLQETFQAYRQYRNESLVKIHNATSQQELIRLRAALHQVYDGSGKLIKLPNDHDFAKLRSI